MRQLLMVGLSQSLAKTRLVLGCPLKKWLTSSKTSGGVPSFSPRSSSSPVFGGPHSPSARAPYLVTPLRIIFPQFLWLRLVAPPLEPSDLPTRQISGDHTGRSRRMSRRGVIMPAQNDFFLHCAGGSSPVPTTAFSAGCVKGRVSFRVSPFAKISARRLVASLAAAMLCSNPSAGSAEEPLKLAGSQLEPIKWTELAGWSADDHIAAFAAYQASCQASRRLGHADEQRPLQSALLNICRRASGLSPQDFAGCPHLLRG